MSDSQDAPAIETKDSPTSRRRSPLDYFEELRADIRFVESLETIYAMKYPGTPPPEPEWPQIAHFEVRDWVGHGGYGAVVIGRDTRLDRLVALKLCPATLDPEAERKFRREVQLLAGFSHPNIVTVFEIGCHGGDFFCAMEYIDGVDGAAYLGTDPSHAEIVETYCRAGEGLAAAHGKGIVHADFKPPNVLIGNDGRVCVADFGLARRIAESDEATEPGSSSYRGGTLPYVAPELLGGARLSAASDQWAFCVSLWLSLFLRHPFAGKDETSLLVSISFGPKPATAPAGLRADVREILCRGLSIDPADRYPSMRALVDELRRLLSDAESEAKPGPLPGAEPAPVDPSPPEDEQAAVEISATSERQERGWAHVIGLGALGGFLAMTLMLVAFFGSETSKPPALRFPGGDRFGDLSEWLVGLQMFAEAKTASDRGELQSAYVAWREGWGPVHAQTPHFAAVASVNLAQAIAARHPDRVIAAWIANQAADAFQTMGAWEQAVETRNKTAELYRAAGDEHAALKQESCAAAHVLGEPC